MSAALNALPWVKLTDRERAVWCAAYVAAGGNPAAAARAADAEVRALRTLGLDSELTLDPEYDAARAGLHFELEEFEPWYRVAWKIRHPTSFHTPTPAEIREAYDRYQQGRGDFY